SCSKGSSDNDEERSEGANSSNDSGEDNTESISSEKVDDDIEELLAEADLLRSQRSVFVQRAEDAAENFLEPFTEDGSSSPMLYALMAYIERQVNDTEPSISECQCCVELATKVETLKNHNQKLCDALI
ncbi:MAG: hypothetical protein Q8755_02970, partial [Candidatus Phytoplasma australasiaticum]|nr:hypothetical protein [Candidatus Phytoplasma australasiaticum]